jgi:hypothetical protein
MKLTTRHHSYLLLGVGIAVSVALGMVSGSIRIKVNQGRNKPENQPSAVDAAQPHGTQQSAGAGTLRVNHSLYRRPTGCGAQRAVIVNKGGWDWMDSPPSEAVL